MTALLDVNILLTLHNPRHTHYRLACNWFWGNESRNFATCPMTQTGLLRLLVQGLPGMAAYTYKEARQALLEVVKYPNHIYWPDSPSYLEAVDTIMARIQGYRQITDAYLLGLAIHNGGKLATLDKGILHLSGPEFAQHVELIA